jgi:WD40 repeat protein
MFRPHTTVEGRLIDPDAIQSRTDLGEALTTLRQKAGLTIRGLAKRAALPPATTDDYLRARHLPGVTQVAQFRALLVACGVTGEAELECWEKAVQRVRAGSDGRTRRRLGAAAPYRGLAAFEPGDADLFFGRDKMVTGLAERLNRLRQQAGPRLMFLIGASGAGKSSVLRAGLLSAVPSGIVIVPGHDPIAELERATKETPALLVVDQFEEIYTLAEPDQAREFIDRLLNPDLGVPVVAGLRADFFARVAADPRLVESLQTWQIVLTPPTDEETRALIVGPAKARGVAVDDALVDILVTDTRQSASALPLLSHALLSAWEHRRDDRRLTVADYQAAGGLRGAVQQSAESAYTQLDPGRRELARRMFLRLVTADEDVVITKRRIDRDELPGGAEPGDGALVIEAFVAQRLITVDRRHVEISHDALLNAWPRMAEWVAADHAGLLTFRRITRAANDWAANGEDAHLLLRGSRLAGAEEWAADPDHDAAMNRRERAFITASIAARTAEQRSARRALRVLTWLACGLVAALVVSLLSTMHAIRAGKTAEQARDEALSRQVAIESSRALITDPALAEQLALAAYTIAPTADAGSALLDATATGIVSRLVGPSGPTALALSPARDLLAVSDARRGATVLYRVAGGLPVQRIGAVPGAAADQVFALGFGPDGRTLATGGTGGRVRLFDVSDPAHVVAQAAPPGTAEAIESLAFSPDGLSLVAGGAGPGLREWRRDGSLWHEVPVSGAGKVVQTVAFGPDGRSFVTGGSDGILRRWTTGRFAPSATTPLGSSAITTAAFVPSGSGVLVGTKDGAARIVTPTGVHSLDTGFTTWVNGAAFSPDGKLLAVGGSNGTIALFDAGSVTRLGTVAGSSPVTGLAWTKEGQALLVAAADGVLRSFPVSRRAISAGGGPIFSVGYDRSGQRMVFASTGSTGQLVSHRSGASVPFPLPASLGRPDGTSAVSPDGHLSVAGSSSGKVALVGDGVSTVLTGASDVIESLAFSPSGQVVAAASDDGRVHLWDVRDPRSPVTLPALGSGGLAASVAFSPDGHLLAAASVDKHVHLWEVSDPAHARTLASPGGFDNYAWSVAFSPDSRTLAAGGADDTVRLWDVTDPTRPHAAGPILTGPTHYVYSLAFNPRGTALAAAGGDGSVWTWHLSEGTGTSATALYAANLGGSTYAVAYSPDGSTLAAAGNMGAITLFDTDPVATAAAICRRGGERLTEDEWTRYVPGAPYRDSCS